MENSTPAHYVGTFTNEKLPQIRKYIEKQFAATKANSLTMEEKMARVDWLTECIKFIDQIIKAKGGKN